MSMPLNAFHEYAHFDAELQSSGHSKWGLVIYQRSEPRHEPSWDALDRKIRGGLVFTVFEDRDLLDGASKETVLRRFTQWADSKPWHEEQPPGCRQAGSARYEMCLMVDETSLQSILKQPEGFFPPDIGDWDGEEDGAGFEYALRYKGTSAVTGDGNVENCWLRLSCNFLTLRWYALLRSGGWYNEYQQHPDIAVG
ncbi:hypothetical protein BDZ85DRAFT_283403 [Elsinoe ampelina]|uniref:Uncharacterized protein n=1 Tax=Elsinoe ampelina TaxID=302913 RepID=A0A6A6G7F0_9PEZI|nr:hypothetical protein BDZ85DRAFT_283403 [Elsinoe ampelina]